MGLVFHRRIESLNNANGVFQFTMRTAMLRKITVHAVEAIGGMNLRVHADGLFYILTRVESGTIERLENGWPQAVITPGQGILTAPASRAATRLTGAFRCIAITISVEAVQRAFLDVIGQRITTPIETLGIADLRGTHLGQRIDFILEQLEIPNGVFERLPLLGYDVQDYLIQDLIRRYPHSHRHLLDKHLGGSARRHVDKLEEFLIENLPDPKIDAPIMAKAVGVNERTLRESCHRIYGCGSLEVLRRMRLDRAHQRLENPQPGDTVEIIARACGFRSRFTEYYEEMHHETPSETLRRGLRKIREASKAAKSGQR
jgi:AraC-like DNA-binding protein